MPNNQKLLPVYIFQIVPLLIYPPRTLASGWAVIIILAAIFVLLGFGLQKGRNWALSLSLTMQGFNVVVRLLMLFPNAMDSLSDGSKVFDAPYIVMSIISIALSMYFLLRLDRPDVRSTIVA
jgi:hypothetical protein